MVERFVVTKCGMPFTYKFYNSIGLVLLLSQPSIAASGATPMQYLLLSSAQGLKTSPALRQIVCSNKTVPTQCQPTMALLWLLHSYNSYKNNYCLTFGKTITATIGLSFLVNTVYIEIYAIQVYFH